jgi:endoglucanase
VSVSNWQLAFDMNQATINQSWNGNFTHQGGRYTVVPPDWAKTIPPKQTVSLGFCASKRGPDYTPQRIRPILMSLTGLE